MTQPDSRNQLFTGKYFSTDPYAGVNFARYSQAWWSNRYTSKLTRWFGPPPGRVFELGCWMGHLLAWLTDRPWVFGSKINTLGSCSSQAECASGSFTRLSGDWPYACMEVIFDIVIAKHDIEYLSYPHKAVEEMDRVVKSGGLLILITPKLS
jgi:SAM-dependent methyltransferase